MQGTVCKQCNFWNNLYFYLWIYSIVHAISYFPYYDLSVSQLSWFYNLQWCEIYRPLPLRISCLEPYWQVIVHYILPFLNKHCVNWNILHRYHSSHSVLNKHFNMGDNHSIFTIFYYWRSRDVIWHFFKFTLELSFLVYSWEGLSDFSHSLAMDCIVYFVFHQW